MEFPSGRRVCVRGVVDAGTLRTVLQELRFVWPQAQSGTVSMSAAPLSMLLEGIDWRRPKRSAPAPQDPDRVPPTRVV